MKGSGESLFYQRVVNPEKIQAIKYRIEERNIKERTSQHLKNVRRVICEAPCQNQFEQLWYALKDSRIFQEHYRFAQYKYDDVDGNVNLIAGSEVGEELYRDIMSKDSQLVLLRAKIQGNLEKIQLQYNSSRQIEKDGSVRVSLGWLLHDLVLMIETQLYLMKSTLDLYATFTQFFFPPSEHSLPGQMGDQIKYFTKPEAMRTDIEYGGYLSGKMDWFYRLKALRDAITHFGSLMLIMEETPNNQTEIFFYPRRSHVLESRVPFSNIEDIVKDYLSFQVFYKSHFLKVIG